MATSGISNYTVPASEIITEALELLGVLGEGEDPTSDQTTSSLRTLNMMTKAWQADGLNLFSVLTRRFPLVPGKGAYNLSSTTYQSTVSALTDPGPDGFVHLSDPDNLIFPGEQDEYLDWTITLENGSSSPISLSFFFLGALVIQVTDGLTGAVAGPYGVLTPPGETPPVRASTEEASRPLSILEAYYKVDGQPRVPLDIISRQEFGDLPYTNTLGTPSQVYYDPQRVNGTVNVWPTGEAGVSGHLEIVHQKNSDTMVSADLSADYPQEWLMPLAYNLAKFLAPKYGTPQMDYSRILQQARELYQTVRDSDTEFGTSVYLQPGRD